MKKKNLQSNVLIIFTLLALIIMSLTLTCKTSAVAVSVTMTSPMTEQIIPYYEVWLRWNDVGQEDHYLVSVRNLTASGQPSVYSNAYVAKNSTHFVIPLNKLTRGSTYRWCVYTVDSEGNQAYSGARTFQIEYGDANGNDTHLWKTGYSSASHLDYFIHAPNSGKDSIIQSSVNAWNGISSNVYLHRDYSNTTKELGIYENASVDNPNVYGRTYPGGKAYNYQNVYDYRVISYVDIDIYYNVTPNDYAIETTTMHEVGHALSLGHTNGVDPDAVSGNSIAYTKSGVLVPLIMNQGVQKSSEITFVDRDHLRIKWGA